MSRFAAKLTAELAAAVHGRSQAHQLRQLRAGQTSSTTARPRPMSERIDDRARRAIACVRNLQVHVRVLVSDPQEKRETLIALRRTLATLRRATAQQRAVNANPPHRAADDQFRADCRRAMARYGVTATEAARIIVMEIAPGLPPAAREDLLRPSLWDEKQQIRHLADRLQPRTRTKARS